MDQFARPQEDLLFRTACRIAIIISLSACTAEDEVAAPPADDQSESQAPQILPRLIRVSTERITSELLIPLSNIAVTSTGAVFAFATADESPMLAVFDSSGVLLRRFGALGEGPGELRGAGFLAVRGDTFVVVAPSRPVAIFFDSDGHLISERRLKTSVSAGIGFTGKTVELAIFEGPSGLSRLFSEDLDDGRMVDIIGLSDPFVQEAAAAGPGSSLWPPPYLRHGERVLVGNGATYRIKAIPSYSGKTQVFGRDLAPRKRGPIEFGEQKALLELPARHGRAFAIARLDTLEREIVPHFGDNSLHVDGKGRTWVFGGHQDSTFADVFVGAEFIGRHTLPCLTPQRGIAVNGVWVALRCRSYGEEGALELQIYRIE